MRRLCLWLTLPVALAALSACAGSPTPSAGLLGSPSALPPRPAAHAHALPSQLLFVPLENGTIDIYPLHNPNKNGVVGQITGLTASQQGMTVNGNGNLYVVNNGAYGNDDYVSVFAPPYTGAPTILNTMWQNEVFNPEGVGVNASGTVYVSSCGGYCLETAAVYVYPPGATSPSQQITTPQFNSLAGLAANARGDLYIAAWSDQSFALDVFKMKAGSSKPKALHLHGLVTGNGGNGVALDARGDLYVSATSSGSNYILEYKPGQRNAYKMIDSLPFTVSPLMLDVGPDGDLYVPVSCAFGPCTLVYGFKPGARKAFESIGTVQNAADTSGVATAPNLLLQGSK